MINYLHNNKESLTSKAVKFFLRIMRYKKRIENQFINGRFNEHDQPLPPKKLKKQFSIQQNIYEGRNVFTLQPGKPDNTIVFYLHGGAYVHGFTPQHWQLAASLIQTTNSIFIIPDYPLAPLSTADITFPFVYELYKQKCLQSNSKIILSGDSSGGGLALALLQQLIKDGLQQPAATIIISPWLDAALTNPETEKLQRYDYFLSIKGLQQAGKVYANDNNKHASPLHGNLEQINNLHLFTGTHDILYPDILLLHQRLSALGGKNFYYEYPNMMHNWLLVKQLPEARQAIKQITKIIYSAGL